MYGRTVDNLLQQTILQFRAMMVKTSLTEGEAAKRYVERTGMVGSGALVSMGREYIKSRR